MAATLAPSQPIPPSSNEILPPTSPRKKRRRAPTTGAADDCFACQDLHTACDRRRPYCTQCLDRGKDCSGYKTVLTWGVGVASRGKLRGLALPIAKSRKVAPVENEKPAKKRSTGSMSKPRLNQSSGGIKQEPVADAKFTPSNSNLGTPTTTTFGFINVDPNAPATAPPPPINGFQWSQPPMQSSSRRGTTGAVQGSNIKRGLRRHSLEPLHVPPMPLPDFGQIPMTAGIYGAYKDNAYGSAIACSPMTPTFGFDPHIQVYKPYPQQPMVASPADIGFYPSIDTRSWPSETVSSSLASDQSRGDNDRFFADPDVAHTLDHLLTSQTVPTAHDLANDDVEEVNRTLDTNNHHIDFDTADFTFAEDLELDSTMILGRSMPTTRLGSTPQLQFLIHYYDRVISPVIVAFDGPTNPYRTHILRLAMGSETLQHAIAALSASNIRLRKQQQEQQAQLGGFERSASTSDQSVRQSTFAYNALCSSEMSQTAEVALLLRTPSADELFHKGESIRSLNMQLADPSRRKDDSILATLLVLCLYHICDTGVAKFKTQFAGVKKILALRGEIGSNSKETRWLTTMFKWFDAMTATVNDREGQFFGLGAPGSGDNDDDDDSADAYFDGDEWALENLAGCDGRLFRIISQLGRLNLLSQRKPVSNNGGAPTAPSPNATPKPPPVVPKTEDFYSMNHHRFDGNGWGSLVPDDQLFTDPPPPPSSSLPGAYANDSRPHFWAEWHAIRTALLTWQPLTRLDHPLHAASGGSHLTALNLADMVHISESFRFSALLYIERLAHPHVPSSAANFQSLVRSSLYHIKEVRSDVFLLWPLFITGTECTDEGDREVIRRRCWDIQKDSGFFNNISGLELLERAWAGVKGSGGKGRGDGAFRWREAMGEVDGEYIVI